MSLFTHNFRQIVMPRLRETARRQAFLVAAESIEYSDAITAIWDIARSRGAGYLPRDVHDDLRDWIAATLLTEIDAAEAKISGLSSAQEARRIADPVAYYTELAAPSPGLEWAFAAISPEYRAHLLAVKRGP